MLWTKLGLNKLRLSKLQLQREKLKKLHLTKRHYLIAGGAVLLLAALAGGANAMGAATPLRCRSTLASTLI